jgi:hypothetical protein
MHWCYDSAEWWTRQTTAERAFHRLGPGGQDEGRGPRPHVGEGQVVGDGAVLDDGLVDAHQQNMVGKLGSFGQGRGPFLRCYFLVCSG